MGGDFEKSSRTAEKNKREDQEEKETSCASRKTLTPLVAMDDRVQVVQVVQGSAPTMGVGGVVWPKPRRGRPTCL